MRAGSIILTNTYDLLKEDFGISTESYLGTGISVPKISATLAGGLLEYWAPNLPEKHEAVWTWKLSPAFVSGGTTIREALRKDPTPESDAGDYKFKDCIDETSPRFSDCDFKTKLDNETRPILFRCAQFDEDDYKGYVGRPVAKRVFFARLRDVYDLKIADACARTGRMPSNTEENASRGIVEKFFIWVFIPSHEDQALPATWGNFFTHFKEWEKL